MHSEDYTSMANSIQKILGKTISELRELEETDTVAGDVADAPKPFLKKKEDELEEANTDKYMWKDINKALMAAGVNPRTIMKVTAGLRGKAIKEESDVEESTAAYRRSLEKIAKDRQLKNLSKDDRETLSKIAALLAREKQK